jgi:putative transposase
MVATGDGALGFWVALREIYPQTREQRCWVHKTANILNKMPKSLHEKAKALLQDLWRAATRPEASKAFDLFVQTLGAKYPKAVECLVKDREGLLTFYDFPAEHWIPLRTTNPIESTFATVRLRTVRTKGSGSRTACLTMVFQLAQCAEKHWRRIKSKERIPEGIRGVKFVDGIKEKAAGTGILLRTPGEPTWSRLRRGRFDLITPQPKPEGRQARHDGCGKVSHPIWLRRLGG